VLPKALNRTAVVRTVGERGLQELVFKRPSGRSRRWSAAAGRARPGQLRPVILRTRAQARSEWIAGNADGWRRAESPKPVPSGKTCHNDCRAWARKRRKSEAAGPRSLNAYALGSEVGEAARRSGADRGASTRHPALVPTHPRASLPRHRAGPADPMTSPIRSRAYRATRDE